MVPIVTLGSTFLFIATDWSQSLVKLPVWACKTCSLIHSSQFCFPSLSCSCLCLRLLQLICINAFLWFPPRCLLFIGAGQWISNRVESVTDSTVSACGGQLWVQNQDQAELWTFFFFTHSDMECLSCWDPCLIAWLDLDTSNSTWLLWYRQRNGGLVFCPPRLRFWWCLILLVNKS